MARPILTLALLLACTGARAQELRTAPPGRVLGDGDVVEVYVDDRGQIYRELRYHGVIPNIRDHVPLPPRRPGKQPRITWIGFQQRQLFSRVFIQTSKLSDFTLHKPDPRHVVVTFERTTVPLRNNRRDLITSQFRSNVERVDARQRRGKVEVVITLSRPVGYLYKQEGNYVFIDVER